MGSSQNQSCALVNHALPYLLLLIPLIGSLFSLVFWTAIRFNLRRKFSIGKQEGVSPFDCLTVFCAPCFACQELRAVSKEDWDWYDAMNQYPMSPQSYRYLPLTSDGSQQCEKQRLVPREARCPGATQVDP